MLYAFVFGAQLGIVLVVHSVIYELEGDNEAANKITQHNKLYKRKNTVLKSLLHVIIFATVRLSTDG